MEHELIVAELSQRLSSLTRSERDLAASDAADWLEAKTLPKTEYIKLTQILLDAAKSESDAEVRESIFNALSCAADSEWMRSLDWFSLIPLMPELDRQCLEYVLTILGNTGDPACNSTIGRYLSSTDEVVREAAECAFQENVARAARTNST